MRATCGCGYVVTRGPKGYGGGHKLQNRGFRSYHRPNGSNHTKGNELNLHILRRRSNVTKLLYQSGTHGPMVFRLYATKGLTNLNHTNLTYHNLTKRNNLVTNTPNRCAHRRNLRNNNNTLYGRPPTPSVKGHHRKCTNNLIRDNLRRRQNTTSPPTNGNIRRNNSLRKKYRRLPLPRTRVNMNPTKHGDLPLQRSPHHHIRNVNR